MSLLGFCQSLQGDDQILLNDFYKLVSEALEEYVSNGFERLQENIAVSGN